MTSWLRNLLALLAALAASGAAVAAVTLFQHENFAGQRLEASGTIENLALQAFNDTANSIVVERGSWQFCVHAGFQGACVTLGPGQYPSLRAMGMNDTISSLRPLGPDGRPIGGGGPAGPPGAVGPGGPPGLIGAGGPGRPDGGRGQRSAITLFLHDDFQGGGLGLDAAAPDLRQFDANDKASSLVVRQGYWQVCSDIHFGGRCVVFGPGRYPSMHPFGLNDAISSLRPGGRPEQAVGADLLLFEHDQFGGRRVASNGDIDDLRRVDFDHDVSSVVIERGNWELCSQPGFDGRCVVLGPGRHPSMRPYGLNDAIASARRTRLLPGQGPGAGATPWAIPAYDPVAACVHAAQNQVRSEHPRARHIQVDPSSVHSRPERSGVLGVRGSGEVDGRRGTVQFRFECEADDRGAQLTRLRYRD